MRPPWPRSRKNGFWEPSNQVKPRQVSSFLAELSIGSERAMGPPDVGEGPRFCKLRDTRREASNESCWTHIFTDVQVFPQPHKKHF